MPRAIVKTMLTLLLAAVGFYWGGPRMAPIPVLLALTAIDTLLLRRWREAAAWLAALYRGLLFFFLAELFCFLGTYFFWSAGFILIHDAAHVIALYFLLQAMLLFSDTQRCAENSRPACCPAYAENDPRENVARRLLAALIVSAFMAGFFPIYIYLLDRGQHFLSLPQGTTAFSRMVNLLFFPALSLPLSLLLVVQIVCRCKALSPGLRKTFIICLALLAYSYFQLFIHLLEKRLAIFSEEFLEFVPLLPIFYSFLDRPPRPRSGTRKN